MLTRRPRKRRAQMLRQRKRMIKEVPVASASLSQSITCAAAASQPVYNLIIGINNEELGTGRDDGEEGGKRGDKRALRSDEDRKR